MQTLTQVFFSWVAVTLFATVSSFPALAQQGFGNTAQDPDAETFGGEALEWRREYGSGEGLRTFSAFAVDEDDKTIVLVGLSQMPEITQLFTAGRNPIEQLIVQKVDFFGNTLWVKPFSLSTTEPNRARSIALMDDGSYLVTGYYGGLDTMNNFAVKISAEGEEVWKRRVGGVGDQVYEIEVTPDGGFMASGRKNVQGTKKPWLAKFDGAMRMVGEAIYDDFSVANLKFSPDGSFYSVVSSVDSDANKEAITLSKLSATGERQWFKHAIPDIDYAGRTLRLTGVIYEDKHIWVAGNLIDLSRGRKDPATMFLVKLNYDGEIIWTQDYHHDGEYAALGYFAVNDKFMVAQMTLQDRFGEEFQRNFVELNIEDGTLMKKVAIDPDVISDLYFFDDSSLLFMGTRELSVRKYRSGRSYSSSFSFIERRVMNPVQEGD